MNYDCIASAPALQWILFRAHFRLERTDTSKYQRASMIHSPSQQLGNGCPVGGPRTPVSDLRKVAVIGHFCDCLKVQ